MSPKRESSHRQTHVSRVSSCVCERPPNSILARLRASISSSPVLIRSSMRRSKGYGNSRTTAPAILPRFQRNALRIFDMPLFSLVKDQPNRVGQPIPAFFLLGKLLSAGSRQRIKLGLAARLRLTPLRFQPTFLFEAVKGRIQRALIDLHGLSRNLPQPLRDGVAMRRLQRQNLKNQHVERALRDWKSRWRHKINPDVSINRDYLNLRHMTVEHRAPAVKTKIQSVDSTRPPLDSDSGGKSSPVRAEFSAGYLAIF